MNFLNLAKIVLAIVVCLPMALLLRFFFSKLWKEIRVAIDKTGRMNTPKER